MEAMRGRNDILYSSGLDTGIGAISNEEIDANYLTDGTRDLGIDQAFFGYSGRFILFVLDEALRSGRGASSRIR
jgi:hypothetical protein